MMIGTTGEATKTFEERLKKILMVIKILFS
jgi:hypothetical protein